MKAVKALISATAGNQSNFKFDDRRFLENANQYLRLRNRFEKAKANGQQTPHQRALDKMFADVGPDRAKEFRRRFKVEWKAYLRAMNLNGDYFTDKSELPHCQKIGETGENSKCQFNPHTEFCRRYKVKLEALDCQTLAQEGDYREWRKLGYQGGPRKPSFRYPSSRHLPAAKIFGADHFKIDFERSRVQLRLDERSEEPDEWLEFGFIPWPRGYDRKSQDLSVTSLHLNFIGSRARLGFRFEVAAKPSRFTCAQDDIDALRDRFLLPAEESQLLDATRKLVREKFTGDFDSEARILAVDLGRSSAAASVYVGSPSVNRPCSGRQSPDSRTGQPARRASVCASIMSDSICGTCRSVRKLSRKRATRSQTLRR
jgi:hypothetical protein